ncbi:MAG: hypothetical protein IJY04_08665 [Clostridia bacterium]|nr:hypothetical protein [Clostridia bacterium]
MKRINFIIWTVLLLSVFLTGCTRVVKKPADTDLELWITEDVTDFDFSGFHYVPGWMGAEEYLGSKYAPEGTTEEGMLILPEQCVTYIITSYPDYSSRSQHVTGIEITDPTVSFFGITMESSDEEIIAAMTKNGYKQNTEKYAGTPWSDCLYFEDGNVSFMFRDDKISIDAEITNKHGIMF